jgi:hypothetical protein
MLFEFANSHFDSFTLAAQKWRLLQILRRYCSYLPSFLLKLPQEVTTAVDFVR